MEALLAELGAPSNNNTEGEKKKKKKKPKKEGAADEAKNHGLVNKVVPVEMYMDEAIDLAREIASMSPIAIKLAKESVNRAFETHLDEGLHFERKNFYLTFSSEDQKEGMSAFVEKRKPDFHGK